jgi:putative aldouronate transport system substrate-binding protein
MKQHLTQKALAAVLASACILSAAGCSGSSSASSAAASSAAASSAASSEAASSAASSEAASSGAAIEEDPNVSDAGQFPICKEKITLTVMAQQLPWVSDLVNNSYTEAMEKKTNIHIDWQVTPQDGYADKLKLALSTDSYPEVILSGAANSNADVMIYGVSQKIYMPLNGYIEKYGVNMKARWAELPDIKTSMTAPDGNIYVLPTFEGNAGHGAVSDKFWINTAWLTKLGLKTPTTTDEFTEVLKAFKTKDPNGNGQADEVPLSGSINTWAADPYLFLMNSFTYFNGGILRLKDGKFDTAITTDEFKQGLKYMAGLYKDGLIDPAAFTQDQAAMLKLGSQSTTVLGSFDAGHVAMGVDITNLDVSKQYDALMPLKGPNGCQGTPVYDHQYPQGGNTAITNKCKHPAAAVRMMDILYDGYEGNTASLGPKGEVWDVADEGATGVTGEKALWKDISTGNNASNQPKNNYWSGTASGGGPKNWKLYCQFTGDIFDPGNYGGRLIKITNEYEKYPSPYEQQKPMWCDADTSTALTNQAQPITDAMKSAIVAFITGQKDIDKDWAAYLADLDKLGLKDYIAAYQKAYDAGVTK